VAAAGSNAEGSSAGASLAEASELQAQMPLTAATQRAQKILKGKVFCFLKVFPFPDAYKRQEKRTRKIKLLFQRLNTY